MTRLLPVLHSAAALSVVAVLSAVAVGVTAWSLLRRIEVGDVWCG